MKSEIEAIELETAADPTAAIIWLHGLGADGHDFESIVPALGLPATLAVRFVFPHAPRRPVTINMGMVMRAWYDVAGLDLGSKQDAAGIRQSAELVTSLIERENARGIATSRIVLAGFSQGGAVAYHVGLRHPERLAGVVVLSAYLPLADTLAKEASAENREVPILQCHGTFDPMVAMPLGEMARDHVTGLGYQVDWRTYPVEHSVHPREIVDVGLFLSAVLASP